VSNNVNTPTPQHHEAGSIPHDTTETIDLDQEGRDNNMTVGLVRPEEKTEDDFV